MGCVVVYKVDRLSRSLLDFSRIMEILDAQRVAFVSVTQQFNTATSMGRLVLHILLSFAQFEREMIAERTRDKMSAARRKGKWVGGMPVLGYDVDPGGGRLLLNEAEAERVRAIFDLYLRERSLIATAAELRRRAWTTKSWTTKKGRERQGRPFDKTNLFSLLTNVIYLGEVNYKGTIYPGEHPAIVDRTVWGQVQKRLRGNGQSGRRSARVKHRALLAGLLRCAPCGASMVHTYTVKGQRRYRYYVCLKAQKQGWAECPTRAVPAREIERFIIERLRGMGKVPDLAPEGAQGTDASRLASVFSVLDPVWETLFSREQARIVRLLLERVEYDGRKGTLALSIRPGGVQALIEEFGAAETEARA